MTAVTACSNPHVALRVRNRLGILSVGVSRLSVRISAPIQVAWDQRQNFSFPVAKRRSWGIPRSPQLLKNLEIWIYLRMAGAWILGFLCMMAPPVKETFKRNLRFLRWLIILFVHSACHSWLLLPLSSLTFFLFDTGSFLCYKKYTTSSLFRWCYKILQSNIHVPLSWYSELLQRISRPSTRKQVWWIEDPSSFFSSG